MLPHWTAVISETEGSEQIFPRKRSLGAPAETHADVLKCANLKKPKEPIHFPSEL